ncbi:nucleolar protein 11 [Daktulosphaira vitifoliae]|uniref:nucleolar protein 11 n=1 Tax=Daktulosphaira vitifoliae TaxID=58002 RepID=UPI0021AA7A70|nr:nucleolar protein 11 [Daktulosphaira vitifoliae]
MIKLDTSYSLGSIIETNFLGIANDAKIDNVIVTLSKNMVTCFHVSNQNQVYCWSSSDKLSSEVIYDPFSDFYYGVFNYTRIGRWSRDSLSLKDMKKYNFNNKIIKLLTRSDYQNTIVVFENGCCECLKDAIRNRKNIKTAVLGENENIEFSKLCLFRAKAICVIVSVDNKKVKTLNTIPLDNAFIPIRLQITSRKKKLLGYCLRENLDSFSVLTLWSDKCLYSHELYAESESSEYPGKLCAKIDLINSDKAVTIVQLSQDCIAFYGAEPNGEGAALIVYNFHYNMVVSVQHFKNYNNPPNLWCFGNNLLLATGQNLAIVPFTCERNNLSLLMDNNLMEKNEHYVDIEWDMYAKQNSSDKNISNSALPQSKLNEITICDFLKNNQEESLIHILEENNDISDNSIVEILLYCSSNPEKHSKLLLKVFAYPPLNKPLSLRGQIPFENILNLLKILHSLIKKKVIEERLIDWITLIIDCSYQQILLSNDPNVLELIIELQKDVTHKCDYAEALKNVNNTLAVIHNNSVNRKNRSDEPVNNLYKIETINLY